MMLLKLRFADEAAWLAARASVPAGSQIVVIGEVRHTTGRMVDVTGPGGSKMTVPEMVVPENPGYHVDLTSTFVPVEMHPYLQNPDEPKHVFAGNHVLAMPEVFQEADETLMVTRGIGRKLKDEETAKLELDLLKSKLNDDTPKKKKDNIKAAIAICEARISIAELKEQKEKAIEDVRELKGDAKDAARELRDSLTLEIDTAQSEIALLRAARQKGT